MKIGMILDYTFPPDPRVENEALALISQGHEVYLFCLTYGDEPFSENIKGIKVKRYLSNKLEYKLSALAYTVPFYTLLMKRKIGDFLLKNKVEAVHIHDIRIAEAVYKANKFLNLPVVLDLHDNYPEVMKMYPHLNKFPGKYIINPENWKKKEAEFIKKSDYVITVSPEFIDEIYSRGLIDYIKLVLVPNTVRKAFYKDYKMQNSIIEKYKDNFVLLYLGDTHLRRGLLTAIRAIAEIKNFIPQIKLVIVGTNTTDTILKREALALGVTEYIDFEGWQNVALFPSYILASDVCISPLHRSIQHDVAYANKIFQYMSLEKPILVSDAKAQKKITETKKSGLVHQAENVSDFTEKLKFLYDNPEKRKEFGNNGRNFIENEFNWELASQNLVDLYKNLES